MLNIIWALMIITGIIYGILTGNLMNISIGFVDYSKEAVSMCITMLGIIGFWGGIMNVGKNAGIINSLTRMISPLIRFLFPNIPRGHKSLEYITMNIIANVLGLGWAATPPGLKAMEELGNLEKERKTKGYENKSRYVRRASDEMCTFLIINISSLQLIPINIIAYRSQYGSANPSLIVAPAIIATLASTVAGIIYCKFAQRKKSGGKK